MLSITHNCFRVTDYEEQNQMTAEALAVIFNPSLLRPPTNNFGLLMQNMKYTSQLLQMLVTHVSRSKPRMRLEKLSTTLVSPSI